ncbi:MAG: arginine--tRNA ligase, partial [Patescibacteria group bacterium]
RILVEYGDPNTHKLPHIGHLFSYIVGDSFARMLEATGNTVVKANYQGDVGPHVAKSLYGYIQLGQPKPSDAKERVQLLQKCYQEGSTAYEEDPIAKETIDGINKKIYAKDTEILEIWKETRQWSVDYYHQFEQRLGVQQTFHYWESEIWERGKATVKENIGKVFEPSDGAIVFPGEKYGLHTRVFLTKNDTPTYEAKDMGLNIQKYEDWPYDTNLITTASEQNAYFDVVTKALELCFPELVGKVKHVGFGMVSLSTGKMSSRTGQILSAIDLLDTVKEKILEVMKERSDMTAEEKAEIAEKITIGAVKFAFLKQNILQNMKFDLEESVSFEGRSGPYLQYTYARIASILRQIELPSATSKDLELLHSEEEIALTRWLARHSMIVAEAAETLSPHLIAEYAYQTSQLFNTFYSKHSIANEKDEQLQRARYTLAKTTAMVLKYLLGLLGIETVAKM